jgi:uncharacterized protein (TIGR02453 family)
VAFRGWPDEALDFFRGLEADNSKSFWEAHRDTYDRAVRAPLEDLLAEMEPEFGGAQVFRPYRDVRFSPDKTPYKTNIAATVGPMGYLTLSTEGLTAGAGMVHLAPDQLERFRGAVDDDRTGPALEEAVAAVRKAGHECEPHEALKTAPRGFPKDHPRVELLRGKGFVMWHRWEPGPWLRTARARDRIVEVLRDAEPLTAWLAAHVGETAMEPGRR